MAKCPKCGKEITWVIVEEITIHRESFGSGPFLWEASTETIWKCPECKSVLFTGPASEVQQDVEEFLKEG